MGTHVRTRRREVGGGDAHTQTYRHRTTRRPDSHCLLFLRAPPLFRPFLPIHFTGMPVIHDGHPCAHPLCAKRFRDVKLGTQYATVNDWAGSTGRKQPRISTCPQSGEPLLNLRDTPVAWQTLDGKLSCLTGTDLYQEQMRLHRSCGHTEASAEAETKKQNSFYCLYHLDGQYFPRGKGSAKNGVCEGAVIRTDIGNAPPPSRQGDASSRV